MILNHRIGLHYIGTYLVSPCNVRNLASYSGKLRHLLLLGKHIQLRLEHLHGLVLILELRSFVLACYYDSRREMRYSYSRRGLVYVLSARTAGTVRIDPDILVFDLYVDVVLYIRHYIA